MDRFVVAGAGWSVPHGTDTGRHLDIQRMGVRTHRDGRHAAPRAPSCCLPRGPVARLHVWFCLWWWWWWWCVVWIDCGKGSDGGIGNEWSKPVFGAFAFAEEGRPGGQLPASSHEAETRRRRRDGQRGFANSGACHAVPCPCLSSIVGLRPNPNPLLTHTHNSHATYRQQGGWRAAPSTWPAAHPS